MTKSNNNAWQVQPNNKMTLFLNLHKSFLFSIKTDIFFGSSVAKFISFSSPFSSVWRFTPILWFIILGTDIIRRRLLKYIRWLLGHIITRCHLLYFLRVYCKRDQWSLIFLFLVNNEFSYDDCYTDRNNDNVDDHIVWILLLLLFFSLTYLNKT